MPEETDREAVESTDPEVRDDSVDSEPESGQEPIPVRVSPPETGGRDAEAGFGDAPPDEPGVAASDAVEDRGPEAPLCDTEGKEPAETEIAEGNLEGRLDRLAEVVEDGVQKVLDRFEHRLAYDRVKEKQIDALHSEVQKQRTDLVARAVAPLALGVIRLHDDMGKSIEALARKQPEEQTFERFERLVAGFREDLEIVLSQNGVEKYLHPEGPFDASRQQVLRTEPAPDPTLVGHIAQRLRPGFERGREILRKERVVVYREMQPENTTEVETNAAAEED